MNLRKLIGAFALVVVVNLTALADCPLPGQMEGPPCVPVVQLAPDDSPAPAPGAVAESPSVALPSLVEIALNVLALY